MGRFAGGDRVGRMGRDDGLPDRPDGWLYLRLEKRSAGMGVTLPQSHAPENPSVMPPPGTAPDADYFKALQAEVSDKGFLVTSTEDLFNWARTGSLWWMTFGPVLTVGLGGVLTELYGDTSHRVLPIDAAEAEAML